MHARRAGLPLALLVVLAGCGSPPADLFVVERSGPIPGARLTLLVSDDGTVRCNGGPRRDAGSDRLLDARTLVRELGSAAEKDRSLAPGPGSVLRYRVRLEDGMVAFSDTSPGRTAADLSLAAYTREVARQVCGLPR